jgi:hypothetical protein
MFSTTWLKDALERAIRTAAQVLLSILSLDGADVLHLNWAQTASTIATATALSLVMSVLASGGGSPGTASATNAVMANPAAGKHATPDVT